MRKNVSCHSGTYSLYVLARIVGLSNKQSPLAYTRNPALVDDPPVQIFTDGVEVAGSYRVLFPVHGVDGNNLIVIQNGLQYFGRERERERRRERENNTVSEQTEVYRKTILKDENKPKESVWASFLTIRTPAAYSHRNSAIAQYNFSKNGRGTALQISYTSLCKSVK
jgi:hypothetical protein